MLLAGTEHDPDPVSSIAPAPDPCPEDWWSEPRCQQTPWDPSLRVFKSKIIHPRRGMLSARVLFSDYRVLNGAIHSNWQLTMLIASKVLLWANIPVLLCVCFHPSDNHWQQSVPTLCFCTSPDDSCERLLCLIPALTDLTHFIRTKIYFQIESEDMVSFTSPGDIQMFNRSPDIQG